MPSRTSHPLQGLTLLEMLVTLVLLSLIAALLAQVLHQTFRMESLLGRHAVEQHDRALRLAWIAEAVEGLAPMPLGDPQSFHGSVSQFEAVTALAPWYGAEGPQRIKAVIRSTGIESTLWILDERGKAPLQLLSWSGRGGQWSYLDEDGQWRSDWPPPAEPGSLKGQGLPKALKLQIGGEQPAEWLWIPKASALSLANRRLIEQ